MGTPAGDPEPALHGAAAGAPSIAAPDGERAGAPAARRRDRAAVTPRELLGLLGVLFLAFGLRFELLGTRPLWFDEAFSLEVARKTIPEIWAYLHLNDTHPLGYYALLSAWVRWFGTGLAVMRVPSLVLGMGVVVLTWAVGRRLASPAVGVVAAGLVALHPYQIFSSNEMRMYALLGVFALASTWLVWRAVEAPQRVWRWVAYGVSVALMAYTSYYAFLLVPAQALWVLLVVPRREGIVRLGIAAVVAFACYAPWAPALVTLPSRFPWAWRNPLDVYYVASLVTSQTFGTYLFDSGSYFTIGRVALQNYPILIFPFAVLLVLGAIALGGVDRRARSLVVVSWALPLVLVVVVSLVVGRQFAFGRHLVFLEPFAALLLAAGIVHAGDAAPELPRALVPLLAACLVLTYLVPAVGNVQDPRAMPYRWDLAARFLEMEVRPGDVIVYLPGAMSTPIRYYYDAPTPQMFLTFFSHHWTERDAEPAIRQAVQIIGKRAYRRVWLVFSTPWPPGSLEAFVEQLQRAGYGQGPVQDFHEVWVGLLVRGPAR